jgi:iron complex outermembrane recepter protein
MADCHSASQDLTIMTCFTRALRTASLVSTCALSSPVLAQHAQELPSVTIATSAGPGSIASRPLSDEALDSEIFTLRRNSSSDTAGLLARLPGVSANSGGGFSSMPAIRGLSEQRLSILVDGHPIDLSCPNDMNAPLSYTDPQTVVAIHVVTGVAPVSMGGDSIGGVIHVESAPPRFAEAGAALLSGEASTFYRSNDDGFGGAVSITAAGASLSATYTGSYTEAGNYRGGSKGIVRSSEYAKTDHALALATRNSLGLFELKGGYHFSPYEGFPNQYMDMTSNKSWFLNGRYRGVFAWGSVDLRADYRDTDHEMNFLADKGGMADGGMPMVTEVHSANAALKVDLPVSKRDTIRLGGGYHRQWLDDYWPAVPGSMMMGPDTYVNINAGHRDRTELFAEWEARWTGNFSTLAGLRFDRVAMDAGQVAPYSTTGMMNMDDAMAAMAFNALAHGRTDNNWSGSLLASYAPSAGFHVEAGYAHKVRSPNLYERYAWGRGSMSSRMIGWYGDGNGYVGSLDLKPERADTVSAAIAFHDAGMSAWSLKVAPFYTHVDDYIDAVFVKAFTDMMGMPSGFSQLRFANQEAEFYGLDVSGSLALSATTRIEGAASYVHGQNLADKGALYHQMPYNLKLGIVHRAGPLELGADFDWTAEKKRVDATRNEPRTNAYALVNLRAAYTLKGIRLSITAANLFDKAYDLPLGGISLGDNNATGVRRSLPGRGRSIDIGLSTRF